MKGEGLPQAHHELCQWHSLSLEDGLTMPAQRNQQIANATLTLPQFQKETHLLTFPSMASLALRASSEFEKYTNPKPLDLPVSLSYKILTERERLHDKIQAKIT